MAGDRQEGRADGQDLDHHGEAEFSRAAFLRSSGYERDCLIEFLKSLQVLPPGTRYLVVDEKFRKKAWPKWQPRDVERWLKPPAGPAR